MATTVSFPALTQGETWDLELEVTDSTGAAVDMTGASARLSIRSGPDLSSSLLTHGDLTSEVGGGLTLGGTAGTIAILRTGAQTSSWSGGRYYFELKITYADGTTRSEFVGTLKVIGAIAETPP